MAASNRGHKMRTCATSPWIVEEHNNACFIVNDATRQALGYLYFEDEPGQRSAAKLLGKDEARPLENV
jgi:hypothetical protein